MANGRSMTPQRLRTILERQETPRFGRHYIPSTLATREEAPPLSRPKRINSTKLQRAIHVLSNGECGMALLALRHPNLVDLHEQKMLWRLPSVHPLVKLPGVDVSKLPDTSGTFAIAERLGGADLHPYLTFSHPDDPGKTASTLWPYQGDLMPIFCSPDDEPYAVAWNIKDKREAFLSPLTGRRDKGSPAEREAAMFRLQIDRLYHGELNISTHEIAEEDVDACLLANLARVFAYVREPVSIDARGRCLIVDGFRAAMQTSTPPNEFILSAASRRRCTIDDGRTILYQAIWHDDLKVDWFQQILIDHPLSPMTVDPYVRYAAWFAK